MFDFTEGSSKTKYLKEYKKYNGVYTKSDFNRFLGSNTMCKYLNLTPKLSLLKMPEASLL